MKRSRPTTEQRHVVPLLGATEMVATLNGDDPIAIHHCLRRFVKIVRRERRLALRLPTDDENASQDEDSEDEDDDHDDQSSSSSSSSSSSEKDEDKQETTNDDKEPKTKKYKKTESWKEDTAAYNVPFVGTSVSIKDAGVIVKGQWPTGLLRTYLTKSPRAIEFTSDCLVPGTESSSRIHKTLLRQKKGRLSRFIYKNYFRAVRELVTAAVPRNRLLYEATVADNGRDEQNQDQQVDAAWSLFVKEMVKHRLGGFLTLLREEIGNGRGKTGTKGGCGQLATPVLQVLRIMAQTSTETARSVVRAVDQQYHSPESIFRFLLRPKLPLEGTHREMARCAALALASTLAETADSVVLAAVCTPGVRDRRIAAGIFYIALKELCVIENDDNDELADQREEMVSAQTQVMLTMRQLLARATTLKPTLLDIFTRDTVQTITKLSQHAPSLSDGCTFENVLTQTDEYGQDMDQADAVEARRVLFLLLDSGTDSTNSNEVSRRGLLINESLAVKSLTQLVTGSGGLEVQRFVLRCLNSNPHLLLPFVRNFSPGNPKDGFSFLSNLNFVSKLIRNGPPAVLFRGSEAVSSEDICLQILPVNKQGLAKAFQSTNTMILSQSIYLVLFALQKFSKLCPTLPKTIASDLERILASQMPDFHSLVKLLERLNIDQGRKNSYLLSCVYELILQVSQVLPSILHDTNFDPSKLLPNDAGSFANMSNFSQWKLLRSFRELVALSRDMKQGLIQSIQVILGVTITTKHKRVYYEARYCAIALLASFLHVSHMNDAEAQHCFSHEIECWVDGLSLELLEEFCMNLPGAESLPVRGMLDFTRAWQTQGENAAPTQFMSPILIQLLKQSTNLSSGMRLLTLQVTGKCLLFHADPRGAATALLYYAADGDDCASKLKEYAQTLLRPYDQCPVEPFVLLRKSTEALFGKTSFPVRALNCDPSVVADKSNELMRAFSHFSLVTGTETEKGRHFKKLFRLSLILWMSESTKNVSGSASSSGRIKKAARELLGDSSFVDFLCRVSRPNLLASNDQLETRTFVEAWSTSPLSQRNRRQIMVSECLVGPLLPLGELPRRFLVLAHYLCVSPKCKVLGFVIEAAKAHATAAMKQIQEASWDRECLTDLWFCWQNVNPQIHKSVGNSVHTMICSLISGASPTAAALLNCLEELSPREVIHRAYDLGRTSQDGKGCAEFLKRLCIADSARYHAAFVALCENPDPNETIDSLLRQGHLDEIFVSALDMGKDIRLSGALLKFIFRELASRLQERRLLPESVKLFRHVVLSQGHEAYDDKDWQRIAEFSRSLCQLDIASLDVDSVFAVDVFGRILSYYNQPEHALYRSKVIGVEHMIVSVVELIGNEIKQSKTSNPSRLFTATQKASEAFCQIWHAFGADSVTQKESVQRLVRRCLKLGLSPLSALEDELGVSSLRLLRGLVSTFGKSHQPKQGSLTSFLSLILQLTTSHSHFTVLLANQDPSASRQREELVKLILSCFLASDHCTMGDGEMETLQLSACGSTSQLDGMIRSIIGLNSRNAGKEMYLDDLLWQDAPRPSRKMPRADETWDWLPSAIKHCRVFSTLRSFPIDDNVSLASREQMEEWLSNISSGTDSRDDRYSPGLLFPLVFASLESTINVGYMSGESETPAHLDSAKVDLPTVHFVQRLCDVGCLALSLAGLSSKSSEVRRLAVSILYFLTVVLQSETAKQTSAWRERPQLCLLLDSVQRALAIQRADPERNQGSDNARGSVPRVNPLAAVFLARASMILVRPGDDLYPAINRYFLRVQVDHGAFPDLNRTPAFMSLFCNSTEDPKIAEQERLWSLEILRDSFIEDGCWNPLKACHAPELLLSTISMRLGTDDHEDGRVNKHAREIELLLSILLRILVFGGSQARAFMLSRAGLVSWVGGVMSGRPMRVLERNRGCALLFLQLIKHTLKCAVESMGDNCSHALHGLPSAVCRIWDTVLSGSEVWNFAAEGLGMESVSVLLSGILVHCRDILKTPMEALAAPLVNNILCKMVWRDDAHRVDTLVALCSLETSIGNPEEDLELIKNILRLTAMSCPPSNAMTTILRRLSWFADHQSGLSQDSLFMELLCCIRPFACRDEGTRVIWCSLYKDIAHNDGD